MRTRAEVVKIMSDFVDNMNRDAARQQGLQEAEIERTLSEFRPSLDSVNGMLYDLLVDNGLIIGR